MDQSEQIASEQEPGRILFPLLAKRGIAKAWAASADPLADVETECQALAGDAQFTGDLKGYLTANPIIQASSESMLAQFALAAGVRWEDTAPILRPLSRRGWHIGRWLPTFLLIDGPLGQLLRDPLSPLCKRLRGKHTGFPLLGEGRDAFNHDTFRLLRNGFAHWSFEWIDTGRLSEVKVVNWKSGEETVRLSLLECEAFHFLTVSVVRAIDKQIFAAVRLGGG